MGRVIDAGDRLLVIPGETEADVAAELDRLEVEDELSARGLVPLPAPTSWRGEDPEAVMQMHLARVPALEVRRVVPRGTPPSLEARAFAPGSDRGAREGRRYRAVPYEPPQPVRATNNPAPPDRTGDLWTHPWVEPLLALRHTRVLTPGALTWALVRGRDDAAWGPALLAVAALATMDGDSIDPVVAFVRLPMEGAGYCFFCGVRRGDPAVHDAHCKERKAYPMENAYAAEAEP